MRAHVIPVATQISVIDVASNVLAHEQLWSLLLAIVVRADVCVTHGPVVATPGKIARPALEARADDPRGVVFEEPSVRALVGAAAVQRVTAILITGCTAIRPLTVNGIRICLQTGAVGARVSCTSALWHAASV